MSRDRDETKGGEDFASRWSRLKRGAETPPAEAPEAAAEAPAKADERSDEEILRDLDLPDPDTLKAGDDFKRFMSSAVPARIRNRALRRLWTSNPVLANLDRLVDYDDDFTDAAMVPALLKTGYKVGRGWMDDPADEPGDEQAESAAEAEQAAPEADRQAEGAPEAPDATADATAEPVAAEEAEPGGEDRPGTEDDEDDDRRDYAVRSEARADPASRPARMRFRFTEQ